MTIKDFIGRAVYVGDYVFYSTTGRYPESRLCKITRFTEKSMFGEILKHDRPGNYSYGDEVIIKNTFVRLEL